MSYTVVDTIIKSELDIVARKDGRSKNLYITKIMTISPTNRVIKSVFMLGPTELEKLPKA